MITELEYKCRRKGHRNLVCLEVDGLFYTYCPDCVRKTMYHRDFYEFVGISKARSLEQYLETEGYVKKGNLICYRPDYCVIKPIKGYTNSSTRKLIEAIRY